MEDIVQLEILKEKKTIKVPKKTTLLEIVDKYQKHFEYPILISKVNNEFQELSKKIFYDSTIDFLDISYKDGFRAYQRSIILLLVYVIKGLFNKKTRVAIKYSINSNYYCEIVDENIKITKSLLDKIKKEMIKISKEDKKIEKITMSLEEGIKISEKFGLEDKINLIKYRRSSNIDFYRLDWFYNYFSGPMLPSTKYLNLFNLVKEQNGFLVVFPNPKNPKVLNEVKSLKKISKIFEEPYHGTKLLNIENVGDLNNEISNGFLKDIICVTEALQEKKVANIADLIHQQRKNIILVSGPSSSGKTTFAKRLSIQLKVNGITPYVISLDNYYLNRNLIPKDKFGDEDFESLEAIDVKAINKDLETLLKGEFVDIPKFNFKSGRREYKGNYIKIDKNDVLIIEGIHGLNHKIAENISEKNKFKIFISPLTQLNIDDHNILPTTDYRLIRRIVRDNKFRGTDASSNISMWPSVLRGESLNIFPYQEDADIIFNSSLIYEMCILKQYAEPLLFKIDKSMEQYTESRRLIKLIDSFLTINCDLVPNNSILREFIGGSCFYI